MNIQEIDSLLVRVLTKEANTMEIDKFEQWVKQSEKNRLYFEKFQVLWERSSVSYQHLQIDKEKAVEAIKNKINDRDITRSKRIRLIYIRASVAASILLFISFILLKYIPNNPTNVLSYAGNNMVREVMLPDSSIVWLNKKSSLQVSERFNQRNRTVWLEGEAYFKIKRDEKRPFKVFSGKTVTQVLGTSFNIEHNDLNGDVKIIVASGKVAFHKKFTINKDNHLVKGDMAFYDATNNNISFSQNTDPNYNAWQTGVLVFVDTHVSEVCKTLEKHFDKTIITNITDPEAVFTARFNNEGLDKILQILKISLDVKVDVSDDKFLIYK